MISRAAIEAASGAMYRKRTELQHLPLAAIYDELAQAGLSAALAAEGMALVPTSLLNLISSGADFESDQDGPYHQLRAMLKAAGASDAGK